MRILVLNQYFHPDLASTGQLLTELCEDLSVEHDVTVVCGRPSYDPHGATSGKRRFLSRDRHGNVTVLRIWSTSFPRGDILGRLVNYATYMTSCLWGAFRADRPDVILTMTDPPLVAAAALMVSRVRRVPFVYICQDIIPEGAVAVGQMSEGALTRALARLNRVLRARATTVVAIGRDMKDKLVTLGTAPEKIQIIPNWADGRAVKPLDGPSSFRAKQGWEGKFVVMHAGNVGRPQGLETLVEAAALLSGDGDVLVAVVGEGGAKPALQERVRVLGLDNVVFLPYHPKDASSEFLGAADIHVVGLKRGLAGYAVPSKVYGIMAAGKPFIAAIEEVSEPALVVRETGCGLVVPPEDPTALAAAIRRIRGTDPAAMGAAGRIAFEERFDRPQAAAAYRRVLEEAAAQCLPT